MTRQYRATLLLLQWQENRDLPPSERLPSPEQESEDEDEGNDHE